MKVRLAKTAGFCMGVRRAMEMAIKEANRNKGRIFTYGPLIHNRQVLELLEQKNVKEVDNIEGLEDGTLLIRAHGIPPQTRRILKSSKLKIIDATCPRVARVQAIIRYHTNKGYRAVIVGDENHAEVIGLVGYGNGLAVVVSNEGDVDKIPGSDRLIVVAQTTQNEKKYRSIVREIKVRFPDALVFDTICDATSNRQAEVRSLAGQVDGMVVVGGYHSGNTCRLATISESEGVPTFHVETEMDLDREKLSSMEKIGVTAGASTPNWMIKNVVSELESIRSKKETYIGRNMRKMVKFLLLSNFLVALGAFSLSHAATVLSARNYNLAYPLLAFFYVYAMRVMNRFLDKGASTYNDPERAFFYGKYRLFLMVTSIIAVAFSLYIALRLGFMIFIGIAGLCILGITYSIPIFPVRHRHLWRYSKIKDIPGSKTLSEALGWSAVITLIPLLEAPRPDFLTAVVVFYIVLSMAYVRSAFFDILQVQGDLIVGEETLPIILGEEKTGSFLKGIIFSSIILLIVMPLIGVTGPFSFLMLLCFLSLFLSLHAYERRSIHPGPQVEYLMEGNFLLAGLLGLLWQMFS
ncbi:MAG: 4-hydroxy-3-methylbut-2-enyl diphosphate reductase [Deltaproteobacteria bacterium]|nr:4-hydroxy-3-methylbut-2-enyl diphosphate reductase [Deltaproteobacteria bacterium]